MTDRTVFPYLLLHGDVFVPIRLTLSHGGTLIIGDEQIDPTREQLLLFPDHLLILYHHSTELAISLNQIVSIETMFDFPDLQPGEPDDD